MEVSQEAVAEFLAAATTVAVAAPRPLDAVRSSVVSVASLLAASVGDVELGRRVQVLAPLLPWVVDVLASNMGVASSDPGSRPEGGAACDGAVPAPSDPTLTEPCCLVLRRGAWGLEGPASLLAAVPAVRAALGVHGATATVAEHGLWFLVHMSVEGPLGRDQRVRAPMGSRRVCVCACVWGGRGGGGGLGRVF